MPNYQPIKRLPVIGEHGSSRQTIVYGGNRGQTARVLATLVVGAVLALAVFIGWLSTR